MRLSVGFVPDVEEDRNRMKNDSSLNPISYQNSLEKCIMISSLHYCIG